MEKFGRKFFRKKFLRYLLHWPHVPITSDIKNSLISNFPTFETCHVHGREEENGRKGEESLSVEYETNLTNMEKYRIFSTR